MVPLELPSLLPFCQICQFPSAISVLQNGIRPTRSKALLPPDDDIARTQVMNRRSTDTMSRHIFLLSIVLLLAGTRVFAQAGSSEPKADVAFWIDHWSRPPVIVFGPEEEAFYQNMQIILFPYDNHDDPTNPNALESNVQWLKDHPNVRFYIDGYASSRGDWLYNLALSQRRADWVKQLLVSRGIAEGRVKVSAGWGELYPVCPETNDECWSKNKVVRFVYSPN